MSVALLLLGYAALVGVSGPLLLKKTPWTSRAPRLAILTWQALTATVVFSVALAGLVLAVPTMVVSGNLAQMLHACIMALQDRYAAPGGAAMAASGTVLSLAIFLRLGWCLSRGLHRARRDRARHADVLAIVGSARADLGVTVLEDDRPTVYCLPGTGSRIVMTSAALRALNPREREAVIAHERAHIRQRHHLVLAYAVALAQAFRGVALFRTAEQETRRLVEMAADDEAIVDFGSLTLAGALLELAGARAPALSLAASGGHVAGRVKRLLAPRRPLHRAVAVAGALAAGALLALPLVLAAQPAVEAATMSSCPLSEIPASAGQHPAA